MEVALINKGVGILLDKLTAMIEEKRKLRKELKNLLLDIKYEMSMLNELIKKHAKSEKLRWWILLVQELSYDIEDKIDGFAGKLSCSPGAGWVAREFHKQKTKGTAAKFAEEIKVLKERAQTAHTMLKNFKIGDGDAPAPAATEQDGIEPPYVADHELVGIDEPKQELLQLLEAAPAAEQKRLRVISIVGCRGIGKTTLANVVLRSLVDVHCQTLAVASKCQGAKGLLADILSKLLKQEVDATLTLAQLGEALNKHLQTQERFLIVIDDMQKEMWGSIKSSFPVETNGRIIVTTSIQSIAKACSSDGGYVYRMQALGPVQSKELLLKEVFGPRMEQSSDFEGSGIILKKCDGLPLALVNMAQLLKKADLTNKRCSEVCRDLGSLLQTDETLSRMKQVLINSYDNLPDHDLKTCLLSVSIFPKGHQINRKRVIRRWLAEGLVDMDAIRERDDIACSYFDTLIDRSVFQTVHTSNNAAVKTCQIHGIVLDFIVHRSASENFITFIHNNEREIKHAIRRLALHNITTENGAKGIDLSCIRSLTIFGHVGDYIKFHECKFLRVLDLENCMGLRKSYIRKICRLLQLKYLSLRGTDVSKLPSEVSNLHYLETLDLRGSGVSKLPIEVLKLPRLAHLFGKFKLPRQLNKVREGHKLQKFFSRESRLHTLAGFVIDGNIGFQQIMLHIRKLRKVKVWCEDPPSKDSLNVLKSSLQNRLFGENALLSLSINFSGHSMDFLRDLKDPCLLTSAKLQGKLTKLPDFIRSLQELELRLSSTLLSSGCLLALPNLDDLLYLKLVAVEDCPEFSNENFSIKSNGFKKLQRLCIQALKLPKMNIEKGAMKCLTSLQLLCEDISGFPLDYISGTHIKGLKEITLSTTFSTEDKKKDWETAAKKHENRPVVSFAPVALALASGAGHAVNPLGQPAPPVHHFPQARPLA